MIFLSNAIQIIWHFSLMVDRKESVQKKNQTGAVWLYRIYLAKFSILFRNTEDIRNIPPHVTLIKTLKQWNLYFKSLNKFLLQIFILLNKPNNYIFLGHRIWNNLEIQGILFINRARDWAFCVCFEPFFFF